MGKFGFILISFFIFLVPELTVGLESYAVKTYTTDQGLPHNHVQGIAQDQNGFIWIATWDGISRWDGYEFRNYYHNPSDSTSISYFQTNGVFVDFQNNVWVNSNIGISKYNRETDNFTQYDRTCFVNNAALDNDGKFWYNSQAGLQRWDYEKKQFQKLTLQLNTKFELMQKLYPLSIGFDNKNKLWVYGIETQQMFFARCDGQNDKGFIVNFIGTLDMHLYIEPYSKTAIFTFQPFFTVNGRFWLLSNFGEFELEPKSGKFMPFTGFNPEKQFAGMGREAIRKATEYFHFMKPVICTDISTNTMNQVVTETYLIDRQKIFWQALVNEGGVAGGLTRSIPVSKGFKHYFFDQNKPDALNAIFPVLKDRFGTLWAGPANLNELFRINREGKIDQIVPVDQTTWKVASRPRAFLEDSTGIWIGYFNKLLLRYDYKTKQFSKELFMENDMGDRKLPPSFVHLKKEGDDIIIIGYTGIYKYNIKTKKFTNLGTTKDNLSNQFSIYHDTCNGWWIGSSRSTISHYDNQFRKIGQYIIGSGNFNIEDIVQGDGNDLWVSQLGGGIARFDKQTGKSEIFTTADGLSNNTCYGMLKDKHGNIWISTNHGISRFNLKTRHFRTFGPSDGLRIDEFNSDNTYLSADGEMFFGGMGGVVSFYPDSIGEEKKGNPEPLVIEDFKVSGSTRFFRKAVYEMDTVILNKGDNNFQVSFACLDFINADKIKYRYRLKDENDNFVLTDFRHRSINYSNLVPGNYRLELEATNRDGEWVSKTVLIIAIPPYFYQTVWFRLLVIFLLVLLVTYFIFSYNRQIRLKARQQHEELRLESLQGQMNPHFIFNSLNSINYFISQNDRLSANRYIADFSRLIRTILGNTTSDYIPMEKELESLQDYLQLEHLRFGDKFGYLIDVDEILDINTLNVAPGMVQPFIENAIWHGVRGLEGRKGFIRVRFQSLKHAGLVRCTVEDDGIGRKLSEKRKSRLPGKSSRGISIVMERLKIFNNLRKTNFQVKIEDAFSDREEAGTIVTIDIPVKT